MSGDSVGFSTAVEGVRLQSFVGVSTVHGEWVCRFSFGVFTMPEE